MTVPSYKFNWILTNCFSQLIFKMQDLTMSHYLCVTPNYFLNFPWKMLRSGDHVADVKNKHLWKNVNIFNE